MGPENHVTVSLGAPGICYGRLGILQGTVFKLFGPGGTYQS